MSLPARKTLSFLTLFILVFSFMGALPLSVVHAIATPAAADQSLPTNQVPLAGFRSIGAAAPGMKVVVTIEIPLRNQGLLSSLARQVSDPASPMFRDFLTQEQIKQDFEPVSQFNSIMGYLSGVGIPVISTSLDSMIVVGASVAQVQEYLHTPVNVYTNGTLSYYMSGASGLQGAMVYASNSTGLLFKPDLVSAPLSVPNDNVTFVGGEMTPASLRAVYNATSLYTKGYTGYKQTIGILDFDGSGTAASDLAAYDTRFGLPTANLSIEAIGPNDPNVGISYGWDGEISIDLQVSHTMAPGAALRLYIGAQALPLSDLIAQIVGEDRVTTLSQSFGQGCECGFSIFEPGALFYSQVTLTDLFYQMGALEGMTFTASTGDSAGSGASNGPAGAMAYPADSPWVVAVGGTQTYFYNQAGGSEKFAQAAWSAYGFVSEGGSGGVSYLEPKPWYQSSQATPPTFAAGRMEPDLSLQAGLDPGVEVIQAGQIAVYGGTSVASPLFAGLLTLVSQATGKPLGMVDPFLYSLGNNLALYTKAFNPVTVGYIIPWASSFGYNLATGWGAPNIGEIAHLYSTVGPGTGLSVSVSVTNAQGQPQIEFTNGEVMNVQANVTEGSTPVTTGTFTASLSTLSGVSLATPMTYNGTLSAWTASMTMGDQSGIADLEVSGSSSGHSGGGFQELFAGYVANFLTPFPLNPYVTSPLVGGLAVVSQAEDLAGNLQVSAPLNVAVESYSIVGNSYTQIDTISLTPYVSGTLGPILLGFIETSYPAGPINLVAQGDVYGILPFMEGVWLQNTEISPTVFSAPGSVAPGQTIFIDADPITPVNLGCPTSFDDGVFGSYCADVSTGSNVTASLVNSLGVTVSTVSLNYQACREALHICGGGASSINGYLPVPLGSSPGLYSILLKSSYSSFTSLADFGFANLNGSFFGQIMVSNGETTPKLTLSSTPIHIGSVTPATSSPIYEGQKVSILADLRYPNGTEITQGIYTAIFYPSTDANQYRVISHTEYVGGTSVVLAYDPAIKQWVGNFTMPSPYSAGSLSTSLYNLISYGGPYYVYVNGHSYDGVPTATAESGALSFYVQPFTLSSGQTLSSIPQAPGWALSGDTITASGTLSDDVFVGNNTLSGGSLTISGSSITGALNVNNEKLTLEGVSGGDISASGSSIALVQSNVDNVTLTGSTISLVDSSYQRITPALLTLSASGVPTQAFNGTESFVVSAVGQGANSLSVWVDGASVGSTGGAPVTVSVVASQLTDGIHTLQATATQADGLSSTQTWYFSTDAHLVAAQNALKAAQAQLQTSQSQLQSSVSTQTSQLQSSINTLSSQLQSANSALSNTQNSLTSTTNLLYLVIALYVVAVGIGLLALFRRPKA